MNQRFFSPKEANQTLPSVKRMVDEILARAKEIRSIYASFDFSKRREERLKQLDAEMQSLMREMEAIGCYYKDWTFEIGLVDFPAIIHGQQALLCWRSDEPEVAWFHGFDDGFVGRRPITPELIFS